MPRDFSPCSVTVDNASPQLMAQPVRHYPYIATLDVPVAELLLVPFFRAGKAIGTIWAVSHDDEGRFDAEDARILTNLSQFVSAAVTSLDNISRLEETRHKLNDMAAQMETALKAGAIAIWTWDVQNDRVFADANMAGLFSVSAADANGGPIAVYLNAIHAEDRMRVAETISQALASKESYEIEYRVVRRDGAVRWIMARGTITRDDADHAGRFPGVVIDITERKLAEAALVSGERKYREMLGRLPVACYILDAEGKLTFFNEAAKRLWGRVPVLGRDNWCGSYAMETIDGSPLPLDLCPAAIALKEKRSLRGMEACVVQPDGTKRHVIPYPDPIFDDEGNCVGLINVIVDVSEERLAVRHLHESANRFRLLSEVVALQVWTADAQGLLDFANQECAQYFGAAVATDVLGNAWTQFVHPEDLPAAAAAWQVSIGTGKSYEVEFRLRRNDGVFRWFLVRAEAMRDREGKINKWFGSNTDIDDLKTAQRLAERANRSKDDFIAALSHELRTPLTPALLTVSALREDNRLPADITEQLGVIERNITLEARLIDDLLDLTAISHGKLQLRAQLCDAHSLVGLAVEIVRGDARAKAIKITRAFNAERSGLQADPARFQQVIWNLLRNAVKFTPKGGEISIQTDDREDEDGNVWLRIRVVDTGIGIASERLEQIFKPFDQGDLKGAHRFGGIGLGLAIARAVVDLHGGKIFAESGGADAGSTFTVEFSGAVLPAAGIFDPAAGGPTDRDFSSDDAPDSTRSLRLLLVEDHEATLNILSALLRKDGHVVTPAGSLATALAKAAEQKFDLVVSDLGLTDGTGIELMERLRSLYGLGGVALSGYGMEEDLARSRAAGFIAHLVKPVNFGELRKVLEDLR